MQYALILFLIKCEEPLKGTMCLKLDCDSAVCLQRNYKSTICTRRNSEINVFILIPV